MSLMEFLLDLSTDPLAMVRFRRDRRKALEEAKLSESERDAVLGGNPKTLRTMLLQMGTGKTPNGVSASSVPMQPGPTPTPEPELEIEPPEPVELNPPPDPLPPSPVIIQPPPDVDVDVDADEATSVAPATWCMDQFDSMWESEGLTVVGLGIRGGLQTTPEAQLCIRDSGKVLYLVADPISEAWIQKLNRSSESLSGFYETGKRRIDIYNNIVERIMERLRECREVCLVLYGHPGVLAYPARESMKRARREGFPARMFPGVSAEDNLFADLGVDFGATGLQSYEVTRFLVHRYQFDPSAGLVLWQIGVLGETKWNPPHTAVRGRLKILAEYLARYYGPEHEVVLYHAPEVVTGRPRAESLALSQLPTAEVLTISTLYVPPRCQPRRDTEAERELMNA